jgi:hypothetical protein
MVSAGTWPVLSCDPIRGGRRAGKQRSDLAARQIAVLNSNREEIGGCATTARLAYRVHRRL